MNLKKIICLGSVLIASACTNFATTLTFDEFVGQDYIGFPNGYGGLNQQNFQILNPFQTGYGNTGYGHGVVSGTGVLYNGGADPARIYVTSGTFDLNSGYFTSAWNDQNITVAGYTGNHVLSYSQTSSIVTSGPTFLSFNYTGVNEVWFYSNGGSQMAIDNLTVNANSETNSVPDTGITAGLLATSLLGLGALRRRFGRV